MTRTARQQAEAAATATDKDVRAGHGMERTANILGALAVALSGRITSETSALSGVSPSAVSALIQIHFYPGICVEQIRSQIWVSHSATVRVIDSLEDAGLIERRRVDGRDGRVMSLFMTDRGAGVVTEVLNRRNSITRAMVTSFPPHEQPLVERVVCGLISSLVQPGPEQEYVCRFCDLSACPQDQCPMTLLDDLAPGSGA